MYYVSLSLRSKNNYHLSGLLGEWYTAFLPSWFINEGLIIALLRILLRLLGFTSIVGFYFDCWVLLRLLGFTSIVGFCVDCWDLFKLWKFCIILVELEKKFWIGKYIAEYTMMRQMKPQILFKPRHTEKWTHFCTNHDHHEDGWVPVATGEYWWVPASTGGYWCILEGTGGYQCPLVESKYYIATNLDWNKLRLLQT